MRETFVRTGCDCFVYKLHSCPDAFEGLAITPTQSDILDGLTAVTNRNKVYALVL
jgi:hypothetical protein